MKALINLATYIQNLSKKDFEKYLVIFLIGVTLLGGILTYRTYSKSSTLIQKIKNTQRLARKAEEMIQKNEQLKLKEEQLQELLKQNKEFDLRTFLEQFWPHHQVTPEAGWGETTTLPIEGNDKFDEVTLTAVIKNQTTEGLTKILDALGKEDIIHIKELTIKHEPNKKITFELTIATMKYKRGL